MKKGQDIWILPLGLGPLGIMDFELFQETDSLKGMGTCILFFVVVL